MGRWCALRITRISRRWAWYSALSTAIALHAGVSTEAQQRDKLERPGGAPLCRYVTRQAVSEKRLAITSSGNVRYQLKTPCRDGTTHIIFERGGPPSLDVIAKLAALAWPAA